MTEIVAAHLERVARELAWQLKYPGENRCAVCSFGLARTAADGGCVIGNCSYRPYEGSAEYERVTRHRAELALMQGIIQAGLAAALAACARESERPLVEALEKLLAVAKVEKLAAREDHYTTVYWSEKGRGGAAILQAERAVGEKG